MIGPSGLTADRNGQEFGFDPAPPRSGGSSSKYTVPEQVELLAPWVVKQCLAGKAFTARDAWEQIPEFKQAYDSPKGLGDTLGRGHIRSGSMQLHRGVKTSFRAVRENAGRAWDRCTPEQRDQIATDLEMTVEEVIQKIWGLPSVDPKAAVSENGNIDN